MASNSAEKKIANNGTRPDMHLAKSDLELRHMRDI